MPNATTNSHDVLDYSSDNNDTGWNATGKTSLGGMALSDDNSRLFVIKPYGPQPLRSLTRPPERASATASRSPRPLTLPTPGGSGTNCSTGGGNNNKRPFAVTYYRGMVYIGVVTSRERHGECGLCFAYVFSVDPSTLAINATPVFQTPLNYNRGFADPGEAAEWRPWVATMQADSPSLSRCWSKSSLNGNMILGVRDRTGDSALDAGPDGKRTAGDTLRACGTFGSWTIESNGRCGGTGTAPQNTGQGPGEGEFYHNDDFCTTPNGANYHDEVAWGAILYVPGRQHVVSTLLNPISRQISSGATFDGGQLATGTTTRAQLIVPTASTTDSAALASLISARRTGLDRL